MIRIVARVFVCSLAMVLAVGGASAAQAANDSAFVGQTVPAAMPPGSVHTVSVSLKNIGSTTWGDIGAHPYKLGSKSPYDNLNFGVNRIPLEADEAIAPGQTKTFTFSVVAPATEGVYTFQWQLFEQDVESFGAWTDPVDVHVVNSLGSNDCIAGHFGRDGVVGLDNGDMRFLCENGQWYDCGWGYQVSWDLNVSHAQVVGDWACMNREWPHWQPAANMSLFIEYAAPTVMKMGKSYEVSLAVLNAGSTTWSHGTTPYSLGSEHPKDSLTWGVSRVALNPGESVAPGETKTFTFQVTAPSSEGTYVFEWAMLQEFVEWFGPSTGEIPIVVNADGCALDELDDQNPCTFDACGSSGVEHLPVPAGSSCDNSTVCDGREVCDADGYCQSDSPPDLYQYNACVEVFCDAVAGRFELPRAAGAPCDNDNMCDGLEVCDGIDSCLDGALPIIDDNDPCTLDSCNWYVGVVHTSASEDANPCTDDTCDALTGQVSHIPHPQGEACGNGNGLECDSQGSCICPNGTDYQEFGPCRARYCDPHQGIVDEIRPAGWSCSDGIQCNGVETCDGSGQCQATAVPPAGTLCGDVGNVCAGVSICDGNGACVSVEPPPPLTDGDPCTVDSCDRSLGVMHENELDCFFSVGRSYAAGATAIDIDDDSIPDWLITRNTAGTPIQEVLDADHDGIPERAVTRSATGWTIYTDRDDDGFTEWVVSFERDDEHAISSFKTRAYDPLTQALVSESILVRSQTGDQPMISHTVASDYDMDGNFDLRLIPDDGDAANYIPVPQRVINCPPDWDVMMLTQEVLRDAWKTMKFYNPSVAKALRSWFNTDFKVSVECVNFEPGVGGITKPIVDPATGMPGALIRLPRTIFAESDTQRRTVIFHELMHAAGGEKKIYHNFMGYAPLDQVSACATIYRYQLQGAAPNQCLIELCNGIANAPSCGYIGVCISKPADPKARPSIAITRSGNEVCSHCGGDVEPYNPDRPYYQRRCCSLSTAANGTWTRLDPVSGGSRCPNHPDPQYAYWPFVDDYSVPEPWAQSVPQQ